MGPNAEPPPRPPDLSSLKFDRKPMVRWLDPAVLADAGLRVVLSSVFGSYADKRETQATMEEPTHDYRDAEEPFWLDFVADLGDGFDSTYSVACLLGRETLQPAGGATELPRGSVLVMGGDEVYPTGTRSEYEARFRGPYQAALPWAPPGTEPELFAIPGNHDWYDGLTNFARFFCSGRSVGAWRTRQRRSYFALRLPHRWWLVAIDIQLDTYIDDPQLTYFRNVGLERGDRVILLTGTPCWTKVEDGVPFARQPESFKNLQYFRDQVIAPAGATVPVTLTGDRHHYCRYHADDGSHLITAGGGGAYLYPTHTQPETLEIPSADGTTAYRCDESLFPSRAESRKLTRGALTLARHAPRFFAGLAFIYAFFGASLYWALGGRAGWWTGVAGAGLLLLGILTTYAALKGIAKLVAGVVHTALHLAVAAAPAVSLHLLGADGGGWGAVAAAASGLLGFLLGGFIFGAYLILMHTHAPKHANDVLAAQAIPDYKNFLRLRIDEDGLTIHPLGIRRVPRKWEADPDNPDPAAPWLRPVDRDLEAELIETPIVVPGERRDDPQPGLQGTLPREYY
jgi:hypothetical protein